MPRGGRRPGAGAPPGNLNALKHGLRSRQFAHLGALLAQDPGIREALLRVAKRHQLKQRRARDVAALLFTILFERANQIAGGRLNVDLPADDWRSIKQTADRLMPNRYAPAPQNENLAPDNHPANTKRPRQSKKARNPR